MEKTNTLESQIKKYSALALGVVGATAASAQVVYTDLNPDAVLTAAGTAQLGVDLDGDATIDIAFVAFAGSYTTSSPYQMTVDYAIGAAAFASTAASTNGWMATSGDPLAVAAGSPIGASGSFVAAQGNFGGTLSVTYPNSTSYNMTQTMGPLSGAEGYVGVRFDISGAVHYGWVRVEVSSDGLTMTIKDYAYESTAGTAINAGDMGSTTVGLNDITNEVSIRNVGGNLKVELNNASNAEVSITNLSGQKVVNEQMNSSVKVISLNDLSTGIYLANVTTEAGTTTEKIYVK